MTITKYKTKCAGADIQAVEVLRETMLCVFVQRYGTGTEFRANKITEWHQYHDSWEAAHQYLMDKAERRLAEARRSLQLAQSFLGNVKGLRKPEEPKP